MRALSRNLILFFLVVLGAFAQTHNLILIPNPADTKGGRVTWRERKAGGTNEFRLIAPATLAADLDFVLPASDGGPYWSLSTDGGGNFEFREMVWASDLTGGTRQNITGPKTIYSQDLELSRATRATPQSIVFRNRASTLNGTWLIGTSANGSQSQLCVNYTNGGGLLTCYEEGQIRTYVPSRFDGVVSLEANLLMTGNLLADTSLNIYGNDIVSNGSVTVNSFIDIQEGAAPVDPGPGYRRAYIKTGTGLCSRDSSGVETCYGSGGSGPPFEMPFSLTVSGVDKARFYSNLGNVSMYLKNSSNEFGVTLSNFTGGSALYLLDTNGYGGGSLSTGNADGARLALNAADTSRLGLEAAGGTFTSGGFLKTYDLGGATVNRLDENGSYSSLAQTRQLRLLGDIAGSVSFRAPTLVTSYTKWWPSSAGAVGDCLKIDTTDVTALVWGGCLATGYVDTTTNQNISGNKYTSGAWRGSEIAVRESSGAGNVWQSYIGGTGWGVTEVWAAPSGSFPTASLIGNYSSTGVGALLFEDPTTGAERIRIQGGSSTTSPVIAIDRSPGAQARLGADGTRGGYLDLYDTAPTSRVRLNVSTSVAFQANNSSGSSRVTIDGSGTGGKIASAGDEFVVEETGDTNGTMRFRLRNRTGENGMIIENPALGVVDGMWKESSGVQRTIRLENRTGSGFTYLDGALAEFQFGNMASYPGGIGLMANVNGAGVYKGDYFRWFGATSGYVGVTAPNTVTSYSFSWPTAQGTGCLSNDGAGNTSWVACSGGSYVDTTTNQSITGNKYTSGAWRGTEIGTRATSSSGNVWQSYVGGTGWGVTEVWASTSGFYPTAQLVGNYSSGGTAALSFPDPSTGTDSVRVRGGSASTFPSITFTNSGGSTRLTLGVSTVNGYINIYDNSGNISFAADGFGSGRIRVFDGSTLQTGQTTTVTTGGCTMTFVQGVLVAKSGC